MKTKIPIPSQQRRLLLVVLLDTSGSMHEQRMKQLNDGLRNLSESFQHDELASSYIDVAIILFFGETVQVMPIQTADRFEPITLPLKGDGSTPMGKAVFEALKLVQEWKEVREQNKLEYFSPWIMLITDGEPTDEWVDAADQVRAEEAQDNLNFLAIGVEEADMEVLSRFSEKNLPLKVQELKFKDLFQWTSQSMLAIVRSGDQKQTPLLPPITWAERLEKQSSQEIIPSIKREDTSTKITLATRREQNLTPRYLANSIAPYLIAIDDFQRIIDEILGEKHLEVKIKRIGQYSPISMSLEGASTAIPLVKDTIVPWRRKHAENMARLLEADKEAEIKSKRAEILEKRARAQKDREEAARLSAETQKLLAEAEGMRLENEKSRLELHRAKIQLALDLLNKIAPNLSETERIAYLIRLLPPLDTLLFNDLDIENDG